MSMAEESCPEILVGTLGSQAGMIRVEFAVLNLCATFNTFDYRISLSRSK